MKILPIEDRTDFYQRSNWRLNPYQIMAVGFAAVILLGACLLMLPESSQRGESLPFIDALFTATSAVCVTGLVVVDTGSYFSLFGQMVIICLIQTGALGIVTMAALMSIIVRHKMALRDRLVMQEALNSMLTLADIVRLVKAIVKYTFFVEFVGGTILAVRFVWDFGWQGIYFGYWHAVSAFSNAGFDLLGPLGGMGIYVDDIVINLTIPQLIIIGGIGFPVLNELVHERRPSRWSLHTKVVLAATAILIIAGMLIIMGVEWNNKETLGELSVWGKVLASYFQSVTLRTAGFATIDLGGINPATMLAMIMLMFIGASPGSTGGGIKTTTAALILIDVWNEIRGNFENTLFNRRVPLQAGRKAVTVVFASLILVGGFIFLLCVVDNNLLPAHMIIFEVVSAFSTTGLSMGITAQLNDFSKICITIMMFIGRVGPLTFAMALAFRQKKPLIRYPEGKITIG